jgi:hypothetical protein
MLEAASITGCRRASAENPAAGCVAGSASGGVAGSGRAVLSNVFSAADLVLDTSGILSVDAL